MVLLRQEVFALGGDRVRALARADPPAAQQGRGRQPASTRPAASNASKGSAHILKPKILSSISSQFAFFYENLHSLGYLSRGMKHKNLAPP
jgi:hypothetical protein